MAGGPHGEAHAGEAEREEKMQAPRTDVNGMRAQLEKMATKAVSGGAILEMLAEGPQGSSTGSIPVKVKKEEP